MTALVVFLAATVLTAAATTALLRTFRDQNHRICALIDQFNRNHPRRQEHRMTLTPNATAAIAAADFNTDMRELWRMFDEIFATEPPAPGRVPVMPPPLDPAIAMTPWPHDTAADLLVAWQLEPQTVS